MSETTSQIQPPPANDSIGSYFVDIWRRTSKAVARNPEMEHEPDLEDEEEQSPTELDTMSSSGTFFTLGPYKLSIWYNFLDMDGEEAVIQANRPAPMKRMFYYFEISVKKAGTNGRIDIGFTTDSFRAVSKEGLEINSYRYHGHDGLFYRNGHATGETFGTFTTGDTVGGGINYETQEFFFTKNGSGVGTVYNDSKAPMFPIVALRSQNAVVTVNFGKTSFVFNIDEYEAKLRAEQQLKIDNMCIPQYASYGIVRSYLQHYGYKETLNAFDIDLPPIHVVPESGSDEEYCMYALDHRKTLRKLIMSGKIDDTLSSLRKWYPQIVQDDTSPLCFLIHCQKFIELIRCGKLEEAARYGRSEFHRFKKLSVFDDLRKDCAALLAYEQPSTSSVGYLLRDTQLELVADAVNAMILSTNPNVKDSSICKHSSLERLIRQLTACFLEKRSLNGDQGETFKLSRILNSGNTN